MRIACVLLVAAVGCGQTGRVQLELDLPSDPSLNPLHRPIAELTLSATQDGEPLYDATRTVNGTSSAQAFGRLPVGNQLALELTGSAISGRVIGYGRPAGPIDVSADRAVDVSVRMRLPFAYVAGGDGLLAVDATREPGQSYTTVVPSPATTGAVATTTDGAEVVVATTDSMMLVSTADHKVHGAKVALPGPPTEMVLSPDDHWAVLAHDTQDATGVSIVDLAAMRAGNRSTVTFIATASPVSVAANSDLAWVISNQTAPFFCNGQSQIQSIPLGSMPVASKPLDLGEVAVAVATLPSGDALIAEPCSNRVMTLAPEATKPELRVELEGPSAMTVARGRVWIMGHHDGADAHLIVASQPIDGGDLTTLMMPTTEERAVAVALQQSGQDGLVQMTADLSAANRIDVLPDDEHVAILVIAGYNADASGDAGGGQPIIPHLQMVTYEYQLVQLDTGLAAQRLRLDCSITWDSGALLDDFACAQAPGQDVLPNGFVPRGLATLYGRP